MIARMSIPMLALAGTMMAAPLTAQRVSQVEVVPFAGYMVFDDILRGPLGTSLSAGNGSVLGVQIGIPIAGPVSLYGSGGLARSDLTIGVPVLGGVSVGNTEAWMFDGGVEVRIPSGSIAPVLQAGAGAVHYRIDTPIVATQSTNAVAALGAGVDLQLSRGIGLRLMAKDYIGKFDFGDVIFVDINGRTTHNLGLMAGLRIGF
jgi:hypothetical protein